MNRVLRIVLPVAVAAVALAVSLGARDLAAQPQPQLTFQDPCRVEAADATASWTGNASGFSQQSPDATYATGSCARYIVDVEVGPFTVAAQGGYSTTFQLRARPVVPQNGMVPLLDQAQCESLEIDAIFYREQPRAGLERFAGGRTRGTWQVTNGQGVCLVPTQLSGARTGSTTGSTRYRIAAAARLQGAPVKLTAGGSRNTN